ncbi:MAG TPA: protein phosphatase 2C domain-containing protein [Granulicella sp.]|jgi:serine/threonine protein phosphatase PrpC|nr:protein phosphatase 2C domain-containing protein [Granulicella sp.]
MLELEFAQLSDRGLTRDHNEDFLGHVLPSTPAQVHSHGWLFALADGMGGHENGEVASRLAIETMLAGFRKIPKGVMHASLLPRLVQDANHAVYEAGHTHGSHAGGPTGRMGTTLVACALRFDSAVVSHVGDSRCYLFRGGGGGPLTRDHTVADEQLRLGILSPSEAAEADGRHLLTRSLGQELFVAADTITVNVIPGDVLLLCSDGLHGFLPDAMIQHLIHANPSLEQAAEALVSAANKAGGHDNVSVQLIRVLSVERMGLYRGRPYRLL